MSSIAIAFVALAAVAFGYGPTGHEIVGGTADKLLANTAAGARVRTLLDGMSLEKGAVIADEIKAWDKDGVDNPKAFPHYADHPKIDNQLRDFWRANPPTHDRSSGTPSHHWFHYTDVPVLNAQRYSDGQTGRSQWDIVHMIPYCIAVLRREIPENNPRKITKAVAVILLAHYVGDIHQPLHVGAEYFDHAGRAVDPDKGQAGVEDEGGNTIALRLSRGIPEDLLKRGLKLHGFWDNEAVLDNLSVPAALPKEQRFQAIEQAKRRIIEQLAHDQPASWRLPSNVPLKEYAEAWADEILPVAREAHERLQFANVRIQQAEDRTVAAGAASEKPTGDHLGYADWVAGVVRQEIHKAGWRLADLLSQALTSTSLRTTSMPVATPIITVPPASETATTQTAPPGKTATVISRSGFGEYPANYKDIITGYLKANGLDASNIDWQSDPKPAEMPAAGRPVGGYLVIFNTLDGSQRKTRSVLIRDGAVISSFGF